MLLKHVDRVIWRTFGPYTPDVPSPDQTASLLKQSAPTTLKLSIAPDTELTDKGDECSLWTNQKKCDDALVQGVLECPGGGNSCKPCPTDSGTCCWNVTTQAKALQHALEKYDGPELEEVVIEFEGTTSSDQMATAMKALINGKCVDTLKISCVPGVTTIMSKPNLRNNNHPKATDILLGSSTNKGRAYLQCYSYDITSINKSYLHNLKTKRKKFVKQGNVPKLLNNYTSDVEVIQAFVMNSPWLKNNRNKGPDFIADSVFNPPSSTFENGVGFLRVLLDYRVASQRDLVSALIPWDGWDAKAFWDMFYLLFSYEGTDTYPYLGTYPDIFNGVWFSAFRKRLQNNISGWANTVANESFLDGTTADSIKIGMYGGGDDLVKALTHSNT